MEEFLTEQDYGSMKVYVADDHITIVTDIEEIHPCESPIPKMSEEEREKEKLAAIEAALED